LVGLTIPTKPARTPNTPHFRTKEDVSMTIESQIFDIEISAAEVCSWIPLRFPDIPPKFDICLAHQCAEEGRHAGLLLKMLHGLGANVGNAVHNFDIWNRVTRSKTLVEAVCIEHILGEGYALGHDLLNAARFRVLGLNALADVYISLQYDELMHVRDALNFLKSLEAPMDHIIDRHEEEYSATPPPPEWFRVDLRLWVGFTEAQIARQLTKSKKVHLGSLVS
jgi:Protein of unknown function (DUF455)